MKAELIRREENKMYYVLSEPIRYGVDIYGRVDIPKKLSDFRNELKGKNIKYYKHVPSECNVICISDARSHDERIVFAAMIVKGKPTLITSIQIEGEWTSMFYGGDITTVEEPHIYIDRLAKLNGLTFER